MASSSRIDSLKKQYADNQKRYFAALANEYRKAGDLAQSIALCRQHLPEQPNHISGHIVFGQALFEAGELDESRTVFETALSLDPENLIALRHLGDIASQAGDSPAARQWYTRILHADPRNEEIQTLLRGLPDDASEVAVVEDAVAPSAEMSGWAADLAADEASDDAVDQAFAASPPSPVVPAAAAPAIDAFQPPPAPANDFDIARGAGTADGIPLPPPPFDLGAPPAPAADHEAFDLDFGAAGELGLGVHLGATPPPPRLTPPIGMEAIFDEERGSLQGGLAPDIVPTAPAHDFGDDAVDGSFGVRDDFGGELIAGQNISEEMQAIFGAPDGQADFAPTRRDEMGVEDMEFRAPEREAISDDDYAAQVAEAAAAGAASAGTPQVFVTETMAELYLQQGFREEALDVYRQLLAASPHDGSLRERIRRLEAGATASVHIVEEPEMPAHAAAFAFAAPEPEPEAVRGTAREFFGALAARRAPARELTADEPPGFDDGSAHEYGAGDDQALADDLAGPAHTSEPLAFEGSTATGLLDTYGADVREGDVAAGAPVSATPLVSGDAADAVYHPSLDDAPAAAPPAPRSSVPDMLAVAFASDGNGTDAAGAGFSEGSLDRLFDSRSVPRADEAAAASLASAFTGEHEAAPSGRPTRPAEAELSLDRVFRTPQRPATPVAGAQSQPAAGGTPSRGSAAFSFDQFFADAGAPPETPAAPSADPSDVAASDIEQFNSWLEGLKKK